MSKRMLIDASHPEETRVVVLDGNKVEDFDFESASRCPLKGNIYLAKITRVEPSLQAAFVEYGGNRQGFLAFSEVHPDYYQIPVEDRLALIADQSRRLIEEDEEVDTITTNVAPSKPGILPPEASDDDSDDDSGEEPNADAVETSSVDNNGEAPNEASLESSQAQDVESSDLDTPSSPDTDGDAITGDNSEQDAEDDGSPETASVKSEDEAQAQNDEPDVPQIASLDGDEGKPENENGDAEEDATEPPQEEEMAKAGGETESAEVLAESTGTPATLERKSRRTHAPRRRHYKIQEVMRRKQIILVQVVKEERGNKGASLTSYLSLAGRYCVLMPNTPRGGGISRKITSVTDRKRLKSAVQSLELPEGMGLIIRTAGVNRTKAEIKRDYEYLLRLWDSVRELTLKSNAPTIVYEEGNLVKRTIRDLYSKNVSEVSVDGEVGYHEAKDFMRMIMPSHAKNVKFYKDDVSLFQHHQVEAQLDAMFSPVVTLKSGGYIVINQTEALVAIDVNSGKATRAHSIEETARKTNLEAADEIGRQLRLRDLAGLIVIDFIDMEDGKNDRSVEKRLRDAVRNDRARIQVGKISQFGLLEMSRQRLRAGILADSTVSCSHCEGLGYIRSTESASLQLLRALDDEGQQQSAESLIARALDEIIIYTLNNKRSEISRIEQTYEMSIAFQTKDDMSGAPFEIERVGKRSTSKRRKPAVVSIEAGFKEQEETKADAEERPSEAEENTVEAEAPREDEQTDENSGRKRRRRRRRGGRGRGQQNTVATPSASDEPAAQIGSEQTITPDKTADSQSSGATLTQENPEPKKRRRRGRRGRRPAQASKVSGASGQVEKSVSADVANNTAGAGDKHNELPILPDTKEDKSSESPSRKGWWQRKLGM
jgi:ribonuclease E